MIRPPEAGRDERPRILPPDEICQSAQPRLTDQSVTWVFLGAQVSQTAGQEPGGLRMRLLRPCLKRQAPS